MTTPLRDPDSLWDQRMAELGLTGARLLSESRIDPFRRTYEHDGDLLKISQLDHEISGHLRRTDPRFEFRILRHLSAVSSTPKPLGYDEESGMSILRMEYLQGQPLDAVGISGRRAIGIVMRLFRALVGISLRGVSHNDLKPENIMITDSTITVLDFDQATVGSIGSALASNFALRSRLEAGRFGSFAAVIRSLAIRSYPRSANIFRKFWNARYRIKRKNGLPIPLADLPTDTARELAAVWSVASESNASSPGRPIAYYSLDVDGVRLPGERSWEVRWSYLRDATSYEGKRVLELGCNLGLLSTWLLLNAGAAAAYGVDHDPAIVDAARRVGAALRVDPHFAVVDFDRDEGWEARLSSFSPDIVTALNVDHWLQNPARFLSFLSEWPEILFEGHDAVADEYRKLSRLGFHRISLIAISERGRPVFHASKL